MTWRLTEPHPWKSGDWWAVAVLPLPDQIPALAGVTFVDDLDDLGPYKFASLDVERIGQVFLVVRAGAPLRGTEVLVDMEMPRNPVLKWLREDLGIADADYVWVESRLRDPRPIVERLRHAPLAPHLAGARGEIAPDDATRLGLAA